MRDPSISKSLSLRVSIVVVELSFLVAQALAQSKFSPVIQR
jgi:hypothetical protein